MNTLSMYLGIRLVDSIQLDHNKITLPGYIGALTRELKKKHEKMLVNSAVEPEFLFKTKVEMSKGNATTEIRR
jgi:hypothetical protein